MLNSIIYHEIQFFNYLSVLLQERISKELRVRMNEWKEIIVLLNAIMSWQKNWFPAITVTCVTSLYL